MRHSYLAPIKNLPSFILATFIRSLFTRRPSSPPPLPISPRHVTIPETTGSESSQSLRSSSPSSYFSASEHNSQQSSSVASTSVQGSEGALSEAETLEVFQAHRDDEEPTEEDPVDPIQELENLGAQCIVDNIYNNPLFFDLLVARFKGQEIIFGNTVEAWRGLHIVCRNVERRQVEELEEEIIRQNDQANCWEEYVRYRGRIPTAAIREEELLYPDEYRRQQEATEDTLLQALEVAQEMIQEASQVEEDTYEFYIAYD